MVEPTLTDYVHIIFTLFEKFVHHQQQNNPTKRGRPFTFAEKAMIVLFTLLQFRRIYHYKAQQRWLKANPEMLALLGLGQVPHRTTFSRRYKHLNYAHPSFNW